MISQTPEIPFYFPMLFDRLITLITMIMKKRSSLHLWRF